VTLTLWRGAQLLGELRRRSTPHHSSERSRRREPSLSALLVRQAGAPPLEGIWQIHAGIPGIGVQQHAVEPDIVAERANRAAQHQSNSGPVALRPMSPEQAAGVAAELQLTVHDATGKVYLPLQLRLQESRFEPEHYASVLKEAPAEAIVDGVVWTVFVAFASETDAPPADER
jgi:hypothetical protein